MEKFTFKDGVFEMPTLGMKKDGSLFYFYSCSPFNADTRVTTISPNIFAHDWTTTICESKEFEGGVEIDKETWNKEIAKMANAFKEKFTLR